MCYLPLLVEAFPQLLASCLCYPATLLGLMEKDWWHPWRGSVGTCLIHQYWYSEAEKEFLHIPQERGWGDRWGGSFCLSEAAYCFIGFAWVSVAPLELVIAKPGWLWKKWFLPWWLHSGNNGFNLVVVLRKGLGLQVSDRGTSGPCSWLIGQRGCSLNTHLFGCTGS